MFKKAIYIFSALILVLIIALYIFSEPDLSPQWLKDRYADKYSRFEKIQDMDVHYKIDGNGDQKLVLLHGTGSSLHTWDGWVNKMKDSLTIIRLDLPAYGITGPFPDRDYSLEHYLRFLDQFLNRLDLDTFALAGNSFGGYLSWNYALKHPNKVSKLILVDASGYPSDTNIGIFSLARNPITAQLLKRITPRTFIHKNLKEVYANDSRITEQLIDRYWHMAIRKGNRQAFIDRAKTSQSDRSMYISDIKTPTLILWGEEDNWTPVEFAYKFKDDITNSSLIIYPNIGHVAMEETPELSATDALNFLTEID